MAAWVHLYFFIVYNEYTKVYDLKLTLFEFQKTLHLISDLSLIFFVCEKPSGLGRRLIKS